MKVKCVLIIRGNPTFYVFTFLCSIHELTLALRPFRPLHLTYCLD